MTRPELFVFIALFVGWAGIAAWAVRIGRKVDHLTSGITSSSVSSVSEPGVREP